MKWFVRAAVAALIVVVCLEVSLRAILGLGSALLTKPDTAAGYIAVPGQHVHRFFADISVNEYGMRADEVPSTKPSDQTRILMTGDSVTFGTTYIDQASIFASLIQHDLRESGKDAAVLNVSMGGWAPANELGYLQSRGTFDADLVLTVLNTEDLVQPFSRFDPKSSGPTSEPASAITELFGRYLLPRIFKNLQQHDAGSSLSSDDYSVTEEADVLATLDQIRQVARKNGARFGIVFSPSTDAVVGKNEETWRTVIRVFQNWAAAKNIPVIDMTQDYAAHTTAEIYFDGIHLRPLGHRLVAKEVEQAIGPLLASEQDGVATFTGN